MSNWFLICQRNDMRESIHSSLIAVTRRIAHTPTSFYTHGRRADLNMDTQIRKHGEAFIHRKFFTQSLSHTIFSQESLLLRAHDGWTLHQLVVFTNAFTITTPWLSLFSFENFRRGKLTRKDAENRWENQARLMIYMCGGVSATSM